MYLQQIYYTFYKYKLVIWRTLFPNNWLLYLVSCRLSEFISSAVYFDTIYYIPISVDTHINWMYARKIRVRRQDQSPLLKSFITKRTESKVEECMISSFVIQISMSYPEIPNRDNLKLTIVHFGIIKMLQKCSTRNNINSLPHFLGHQIVRTKSLVQPLSLSLSLTSLNQSMNPSKSNKRNRLTITDPDIHFDWWLSTLRRWETDMFFCHHPLFLNNK